MSKVSTADNDPALLTDWRQQAWKLEKAEQ
ncbi:hypothetical protein HEB94_007180 [Actinopolymorpha pittospori]|uniref:Uncharacterized protein n=1 Tax=Actinopolymorpha pittospori TaxID=648752 RepID=A0A927N7E0_9ACTN|nr:hypothetical protein [Actinopolymorpha pittospori]